METIEVPTSPPPHHTRNHGNVWQYGYCRSCKAIVWITSKEAPSRVFRTVGIEDDISCPICNFTNLIIKRIEPPYYLGVDGPEHMKLLTPIVITVRGHDIRLFGIPKESWEYKFDQSCFVCENDIDWYL